jgi:geranylgeranyl diphosphate synthase, type I
MKEYVDSIDSHLADLYSNFDQSTLHEAVTDALSKGGKRVRAVLALLFCEVFSGDYKPGIPAAVAYELAHAAALVQDDIIDHSDMRRGETSIVEKYGLSNAILASNMLLFYVPKKIAEYRYLESDKLCKLFDLIGESCRATTCGEFLDLEMARKDDVSEDEYEEMIRSKTAALLGAPSASGAIVGGASEEEANTAYRFGERLGMAYQIQDDMLDLMGDEEALGKPAFTDLRGGKKNIVLIHALENCSKQERGFLAGLFGKESYTRNEVENARKLFLKYNSIEYSRRKALGHIKEARLILTKVKQSDARSKLLALSHYLSNRYY